MITTPNMGLTKWDLSSDPYSHSQLAANFGAIDSHDHTPGKGVQIPSAGIADGAITSAKIVDGGVATADIANGAVTADKLDKTYVHPVGVIWPWWRPNLSTPVPTGWAIAQGQVLTGSQHDFPGGGSIQLPDLRNKFLLGADVAGTGPGTSTPPDIGYVGGNHTPNLAHTHTVNAHSHTVNAHHHTVLNHAHGIQGENPGTSNNGGHIHYHWSPIAKRFGSPLTFVVVNTDDGFLDTDVDALHTQFNDNAGVGSNCYGVNVTHNDLISAGEVLQRYATFGSAAGDHNHVVAFHAHGGLTAPAAPDTSDSSPATDSQSPGTSTALAGTDTRPGFVGVLYIMKVKY